MIKKYKKTILLTSLLNLVPMVVGLLLWNRLPEQVVVHWDINGTPDGWAGKAVMVFGMPLIMLALNWVCLFATAADPRQKDQSAKPMNLVLWIVPVLNFVCCGMVYGDALSMEINTNTVMFTLLGLLFIVIGNYLPKCKQSYTLGIRLPWTLHSEANWNATHRFTGRLWVIGGVLLWLCVFLVEKAYLWGLLVIGVLLVVPPVVYSYLYYKRFDKQ